MDTLGPADKYQEKLTSRFPKIKFTVKSKADSLFPVVGAASIVAKVTRDRTLTKWMAEKGHAEGTFGCGYPSDPSTCAWLKANVDPVFGYDDIVRFSWSSCDRLLLEHAVKVEWPEEEAAGSKVKAKVPTTNFVQSHRTISAYCGLQTFS